MELTLSVKKVLILFFISLLYGGFCIAQPIITSFVPASGPAGSLVTITGNNFNAVAANNIVFFGAVKASVTTASTTSLTVTVPFGATYQPITVTTNGLTAYSSKPFVQTFAGGTTIGQGSFEPRFDSTADTRPTGIAVADFDGDGKSDLATANNYSTSNAGSVSILRNTSSAAGAISFAPKLNLPTAAYSYAIACGDVNGDGKPDLVYSNIVASTISVLKNTSTPGNISFAAAIDYPAVSGVHSIALNDIDGDGKPDLAFVSYTSQTISVYRNTGTGGNVAFAARLDFMSSPGSRCIAIGDLDGDGKPDLAVSNEFVNSVSAFRNTSTPGSVSFAPKVDFTTGASPFGVAIGDLNNDGKADLAVGNNASSLFSTFRNTSTPGTISFAPKVDFSNVSGQSVVSIGDMNGDGKPDIVLPGTDASVCQNTSTGSVISFGAPVSLFLIAGSFTAAIADLDGDGKDDIASPAFTQNWVSVLRNRNNEPVVDFFFPTTAGTGTTVLITGNNFTGTTAVSFGGVPAASFTVLNNTSINAVVGTGASGTVKVTNQYGTGKRDNFTFAGPPLINSISPSSAGYGQTVTITGANFSGNVSQVRFGNVDALSFTVISPTTITAVVGTGATGDVTVTSNYGTGTIAGFTYLPIPTITSFTPVVATSGTTVSIDGTNFNGATDVSFGGTVSASFIVNSNTNITAVVGTGSSGVVRVTTNFGTATLAGFTFIPAPVVNSFSPTSSQTGNLITITGSNFTGATAVHFGSMPANSFTVVSSTTIHAIVGSGRSGSVRVTTPGGVDSANGFTFIPPVRITSISPDYGPAAGSIVITGTGFSANASNNRVTVGSITANVIAASSTSLTITAPTVAENKPVNVQVNNLIASSILPYRTSFTAPNPAFSSGSFAPEIKLLHGAVAPESFINCDIDSDGKLDIIAPDLINRNLVILRNISSGNSITYAPKVEFTLTQQISYHVVAEDIDGDGKLDIVAGNIILRNTSTPGNISFAAGYSISINTWCLKVADVDGDGRNDIISKPGNDSILIYKNNSIPGTFSFSAQSFFNGSSGNSTTEMNIEDLDGDGKAEIISSHPSLSCLKNNSIPGFVSFSAPIVIFPSLVTDIVYMDVADVDGDGKKDIAVINQGIGKVYLNQSNSSNISFTSHVLSTSTLIWRLRLADLNGDGKPDIFTMGGSQFSPAFSIFRNLSSVGAVSFAPQSIFLTPSIKEIQTLDVGDLDADNKIDLLFCSSQNDTTYIFRNLMGNSQVQICTNNTTTIISNITGTNFQWQQNSGAGFVNINNNINFSGSNTNMLQLSNIPQSFNGYQYRCQIDNVNYSSVTTINVVLSPAANAGRDTSLCAGSSVQLTASGGTIYSWSPAAGLNNASIANPVATTAATTQYIVTVSNATGCFAKDTVVVSINQLSAPTVNITNSNTGICFGTSTTFTALAVNGGPNPAYQWQVNGINVGANSSVFTSTALTHNSQVKVLLTSNSTCATTPNAVSNIITMNVDQLATPLVSVSNMAFTVTNPNAAAVYTWQARNNNTWANVIPTATGISYTAPTTGEYRVKAVKGACTIYSAAALTNLVSSSSHFIYVHPNPTSQFVTFDSINLSKKYESIEIIDMQGRRIMPLINAKNQVSITIDINSLNKGMYMAIFRQWDETYTVVRFVKQ